MSDRIDQQGSTKPAGWHGVSWDASKDSAPLPGSGAQSQGDSVLTRFLGGSPVAVFTRLAVMSLVTGALLIWLDIQPWQIFHALERFVQRIWLMGFDAIREIGSYVLAGAVIVVPVWLLLRLMNMRAR